MKGHCSVTKKVLQICTKTKEMILPSLILQLTTTFSRFSCNVAEEQTNSCFRSKNKSIFTERCEKRIDANVCSNGQRDRKHKLSSILNEEREQSSGLQKKLMNFPQLFKKKKKEKHPRFSPILQEYDTLPDFL